MPYRRLRAERRQTIPTHREAIIDPFDFALLAWAFAFGLAAAWLARRRERVPAAWAVYGAILGPVALTLLWLAPPGRCRVCRSSVRGWTSTCTWCGSDVRGAASRFAPRPVRAVPSPQAIVVAEAAAADVPGVAAGGPEPRTVPPDPATPHPIISVAPTRRPADGDDAAVPAAPSATTVVTPETASSGSTDTKPPSKRASKRPTPASPPGVVLGSGIFVTGTVGLSAGSRYAIEISGHDLRVVATSRTGTAPSPFTRALPGFEATAVDGRLIIASSGRNGAVLVFMSVDGAGPSAVADAINRAVDDAGGTS